MTKTILILLGAAVSAGANAQICNELARSSHSQLRYTVNIDGTATDRHTGLTWLRCPVGYVLDDGGSANVYTDDRCVEDGETLFNWSEALQVAETIPPLPGSGLWRIPNLKELLFITERRCYAPAINAGVFPDTPTSAPFWSSTPRGLSNASYVVDFLNGEPLDFNGQRISNRNYVRLVWWIEP